MKELKLIQLTYNDYNNGDDDEIWLFEHSKFGIKKAVAKIQQLVQQYYSNLVEELEWNINPNDDLDLALNRLAEKHYISYSNSDWLYFYLGINQVELSTKKENDI